MTNELEKLQQLFGYQFQDLRLLERSLTHRSWAYEKMPLGEEADVRELQNESLEFVGDSVLGLAIAEQLYLQHPKSTEGDLTLMKHHLVSSDTLAKIAIELGLGEYLRVGRGEEKTGGRKKNALLADTLEAVIGAIFFDSGYLAACAIVNRIFAKELNRATPMNSVDYKTRLQEMLQAQKLSAPTYTVIGTEGPPHERTFTVEAVWENGTVKGRGSSIKSAEMEAASLVLDELDSTAMDAKRKLLRENTARKEIYFEG